MSPAPSFATRMWSVLGLSVMAAAVWLPGHAWAETGEQPWGWIAGFTIAAAALVAGQAGVVVAVILGAAAAAGGAVFDGSVATNLTTAFGCAAVGWLMCQGYVWQRLRRPLSQLS